MQRHQGTNPATFLNERDREIVAAERERARLDRYIAGLRAAREAMAGVVLDGAMEPRHHSAGSRVGIVREILEASPNPVTVEDIMAELKKRGRHEEKRNVYSTVSYLKNHGLVKNTERGKWASVTQAQAA